ncbi:MAG: sugar ABC transporter permease [Chloroflexota bacterium]
MDPKHPQTRRPWRTIIIFLMPALLFYLALIFYPVMRTVYNSFHTLDMARGMEETYIGISNYKELLTKDKTFRLATTHSLIWGFASPLLEIPLALGLALILYSGVPFERFFRIAWFSPILLSYIVVGIIFRWVFNYDWGVINMLLQKIGLGALAQNWLGTTLTALPSLIMVTTWMFTGFNFVILLSALHSIPKDLLDAARVDGANSFQLIWNIIIPLLQRTISSLLILCFIGKMKLFDLVWVMTKGGPMWATETVSTYVIKRAFHWQTLDLGYPSAIAVLWFVVILVLALLFTRLFRQQELIEF